MGVIVVSSLVIGAYAYGDSRAELDNEQKTAKAEFTEAMKGEVQKFKKLCGVDLTVTTDFENYSDATWRAQQGDDEGRSSRSFGGNCAAVVGVLLRACTNPDYSDRPSGKPPKATRVACVFAGYKPKLAGDTAQDHFQDNMSFKDGLVTINNAPSLYNVEEYTRTVLYSATGLRTTGRNGSSCTSSSACHSNNCKAGTCQACSSRVKCASRGDECSSDGGGVCLTPLSPEQTELRSEREQSSGSSRAEPKAKAVGKRLGQSCASDSECNSRYRCKAVSKTRSTCR